MRGVGEVHVRDVLAGQRRGGRLSPYVTWFEFLPYPSCPQVCLRGLDLDGSLRVEASCPLGHTEAVNANDDNNNANANDSANSDERRLVFSDRGARCRMVGCRVVNAGVDRDDPANVYWKQR